MNATIALPSVKWAPAVGLDVAPIRRPLRHLTYGVPADPPYVRWTRNGG
jgi:hypothetical protein